jgi:hypothetical protein
VNKILNYEQSTPSSVRFDNLLQEYVLYYRYLCWAHMRKCMFRKVYGQNGTHLHVGDVKMYKCTHAEQLTAAEYFESVAIAVIKRSTYCHIVYISKLKVCPKYRPNEYSNSTN